MSNSFAMHHSKVMGGDMQCGFQGCFQSLVMQPSLLFRSQQRDDSSLCGDPEPPLLCGLTRAAWDGVVPRAHTQMLLAANLKATGSLRPR